MLQITISALTGKRHAGNLSMLSQKTKVGIATPNTTGQKAAFLAVFLCPPKIAGLFRLNFMLPEFIRRIFVMVGCIGQLSSWPVPVAGCCNLVQSATLRLQPKGGGYLHYRRNRNA